MRMWRRTDECDLPHGSGFYVRIGDELGYAKLDRIEREKVGSALGRRVGAPVAFVEYAKVDGASDGMIFAVSHVRACTDQEVGEAEETESVKHALSKASGLLAFLRWIGAGDHEAGKNLVLSQSAKGELEVLAIDFGNAFEWPQESLSDSHPLARNIDKALVQDTLTKIEALSDEDIENLCESDGPDSLSASLIEQRSLLRPFLQSRGWLQEQNEG